MHLSETEVPSLVLHSGPEAAGRSDATFADGGDDLVLADVLLDESTAVADLPMSTVRRRLIDPWPLAGAGGAAGHPARLRRGRQGILLVVAGWADYALFQVDYGTWPWQAQAR